MERPDTAERMEKRGVIEPGITPAERPADKTAEQLEEHVVARASKVAKESC